MNLLVELSNGDIEEVEVEDFEIIYHEFWGNEESMAEAQEILYELQQQCATMSADVAELRAFVTTKFDNYDTNIARFYERVMPPLENGVADLQRRMADQERLEAIDSAKLNWLLGVGGMALGGLVTALIGTLF